MGVKNYLIEGVSCSGKTSVCHELRRRGHHALNGDRDLAYSGDIETGEPVEGGAWIWDVNKVRALAADRGQPVTFFCGGSRNSARFLDCFDRAFVLELDSETLEQRLAARPDSEWGGTSADGAAFARFQHATREGFPDGAVSVDATRPLGEVVDMILGHAVDT